MKQGGINCSGNFSLLVKAWQNIQDGLHKAGGISAWLVDDKGYLLTGGEFLPCSCAQVQKNLGGQKICAQAYQKNCSLHYKTRTPFFLFKCHAGLTSFVFPLVVQGQVLGAIVGGGVLVDDKDGRGAIRQARRLHLSPASYLANLKDSPRMSSFELQQSAEAISPLVQDFAKALAKWCKYLRAKHAFALQAHWNQMMRDSLTGLGNKQYLLYRLRQELSITKRQRSSLCLLVIRLENLNTINQKAGHPAGDAILKEFAALLPKVARGMDTAIRYGGNIFALFLFKSDQQEGVNVARRLLGIAKEKKFVFKLRFKLGIFQCTTAHRQPEILARSVQLALEQANLSDSFLGVLPLSVFQSTKYGSMLLQAKQNKRRVVVTGMGVVSSLGCDKEIFRQGLYEGRSGVRRLTLFDPGEFPSQIGGEVLDFEPSKFIDANKVEMLGRASIFAIAAAKMAIADSKLELTAERRKKVGVSIGSAVAGLEFGEAQVYNFLKFGVEELSPYFSIIVFGGAVSSETSIALGVRGRSTTLSTGCAAGTDAIGEAFDQIREGKMDIVLAGGADAPIRQVVFGSFCAIEALSTRYNDCPERASRPFDRERDGFVIAEGAGMLVLEELQHALRRGAHIYGEVIGFGASNDAYHMSQPAPEGEAAAAAINMALKDARLEPRHIEYINVHGSSTPLNDVIETKVIKKVFGKHAYKLAVSSTKSMMGHPIGASGALELIACLLGMENNFIPPTINYEVPDPTCDLDYVPNQARDCPVNIALSNSLGFGGKNASIIISRY